MLIDFVFFDRLSQLLHILLLFIVYLYDLMFDIVDLIIPVNPLPILNETLERSLKYENHYSNHNSNTLLVVPTIKKGFSNRVLNQNRLIFLDRYDK